MRISPRAYARLALPALALATLSLAGPLARAAAPAEKSLPANTIAVIKVDDVSKFRAAFKASQFGQLLADPGMKPLKDNIVSKLEEGNKKAKEAIGLTINEILDLPQGPATFALVAREDAKLPVAGILMADAGKNEAKMDQLLDKLTKLAEKDNGKVATEQFKGMKLTIISPPAGDDAGPKVVWTKKGSAYTITTDAEILKDLVSHVDGRTDSIASTEGYQAVAKKLGTASQGMFYLDVAQVFKLASAAGAANGGNAEQIVAQLQLTGLNGLKSIAGTITFGGEFDSFSKVFIAAPQPVQGLLKIFSMPKVALKPPAWVPATAAGYQSISLDLDNAYKAINELADQFAPGVLDNLQKQIAGPNGESLDFQKDIFGPLGDRITLVGDFKKPITEKSQRTLVGIALEDAKAFQATLAKVFAITKATPKKREFQGTTIYDFDLSGLPNADQMQLDGPISLAVAKDHLFITTEPTILEQVLRSGGASLADSPEYQAVAKNFPEATSTQSYQKPEEGVRLLYDMLKNGGLLKAIKEQNPNADVEKLKEVVDPAKLPDFEVIKKYLAPGGGFGIMDDDGIVFTRFTLKKANP